MRAATIMAILLTCTLAGCTAPEPDRPQDFSTQSLVGNIQPVDGGEFAVGIPAWTSAAAPITDWGEAVSVTSGNGSVTLRDTERGTLLWFTGNGTVRFEAQDIIRLPLGGGSCCERSYLDGDYSTGSAPGGGPWYFVESGDVDIVWRYEGKSDGCYLPINHHATLGGTGWLTFGGGPRQDPRFDCVD